MCNDDDDKEAYSTPAMNVSPAPMVLNIDGGTAKSTPAVSQKNHNLFFCHCVVLC